MSPNSSRKSPPPRSRHQTPSRWLLLLHPGAPSRHPFFSVRRFFFGKAHEAPLPPSDGREVLPSKATGKFSPIPLGKPLIDRTEFPLFQVASLWRETKDTPPFPKKLPILLRSRQESSSSPMFFLPVTPEKVRGVDRQFSRRFGSRAAISVLSPMSYPVEEGKFPPLGFSTYNRDFP